MYIYILLQAGEKWINWEVGYYNWSSGWFDFDFDFDFDFVFSKESAFTALSETCDTEEGTKHLKKAKKSTIAFPFCCWPTSFLSARGFFDRTK